MNTIHNLDAEGPASEFSYVFTTNGYNLMTVKADPAVDKALKDFCTKNKCSPQEITFCNYEFDGGLTVYGVRISVEVSGRKPPDKWFSKQKKTWSFGILSDQMAQEHMKTNG